ncbi:hypothetical protein FEM48_Zijuj04G0052000 [Ziziphus jujuba var. spinosa]|uniref:UDP-glycosyltransferase 83A1-like n=1 Tax=Ziziphus jujuba var. spinosa TaxID=714518 RepID=A0A978VHZ9_ZIZJJ|nr:hypothetical protein FEM48_Zijuj04G0052000 [Ziziphus jujuba var. spinosa]
MGRTGASTSHHVLVISFPVQGHVNPLMLFSHKLALQGFKVSFLNTDFNHKRVLSAMALCDDGKSPVGSKNISLVSIPDGLSPDDDRTDMALLCEAILDNMPAKLEELLTNFNALSDGDDDKKITCVIADGNMGWAMEVATKMGIRGAIFWPAAAATFVMELNIQRMINEGLIDSSGDSTSQKTIFHYVERFVEASKLTDWWLFNTAYDVEPAAISLYPRILPIGPLLASQSLGELGAQFWREDHSCLNWLDKQKPSSVIYVSFGSLTVHDETQINALALGLELTGRPFLWVVRPGMIKSRNDSNPNGFLKSRGFERNEKGIISGEEVKKKVEQVLGDESIRARSLQLKELAMKNIAKDGQSSKNLNDFIKWLKA